MGCIQSTERAEPTTPAGKREPERVGRFLCELGFARHTSVNQGHTPVAVFACLDVDYSPARTCAACVLFARWHSSQPTAELSARLDPHHVAGYVPGAFYERELPALLAVLDKLPFPTDALDALIVDGYVWLGREQPGMGHHLFRATRVPVIGVAKTAFANNEVALPLLRGASQKPLYVTAVGMDPLDARGAIASMHGEHRVPTLLRWVDNACRRR